MAREDRGAKILDEIRKKYPGYHPLMALADVAHDGEANLKLRAECHTTIAKYTEAQLKSVEFNGNLKTDHGVLRVSLYKPKAEEADEEGSVSEEPDEQT
jgi:hypothetical protein